MLLTITHTQKIVKEACILALPDTEYFHQILKSLRLGTIFKAPGVRQMSSLKRIFKKLLTKPRMEDVSKKPKTKDTKTKSTATVRIG